MKTRLNAKNTIDAINTFAIPALSYGYVVLDWSITELETIDRETRKLLKKYHLLHENSDITRLYLTRKLGGRGLTNVTDQYKNQVIQYSCYLRNTGDILLNLVSTWQTTRRAKSIHERANSYCDQLQLDVNEIATKTKEQRKNEIKTKRNTQKRNELKTKEMHGQYVKLLDEAHIDTIKSTNWLRDSRLKRPTEAALCAIQEQAITTKYIRKNVFKTTEDDACRLCRTSKETIHHIISGCPMLSATKYTERHDNVCKLIHMQLARKYELLDNNIEEKWFKYDPEPLLEDENTKILWNFPIQTDHLVRHNKPDLLVIEKKKRKAFIIDIAVPNDNNIMKKRREKMLNYETLSFEIKQLWNLETVSIVPIVVGATGIVHNKFEELIKEKLDINPNTKEIQKIAILGTVYITRYFLQHDI